MRWADAVITRATLVHISLLLVTESTRIQPKEVVSRSEHIVQTVDEQGVLQRPSAESAIENVARYVENSRLSLINENDLTWRDPVNLLLPRAETVPPDSKEHAHHDHAPPMSAKSGQIKVLWFATAPLLVAVIFFYCARLEFGIKPCRNCSRRKINRFEYKGRLIYEWEQTSSRVTLYIQLPENIDDKKLEIKFWPRHIKIGRVGYTAFMKDELYNLIDILASSWTVQKGDQLVVTLQKETKSDWPCVLLGHHPSLRDKKRSSILEPTPEDPSEELSDEDRYM